MKSVFKMSDDAKISDTQAEPNPTTSPLQQIDELNPDPRVLLDLEKHAQSISSNLDMALRDLRGFSVLLFLK